MRSRRSGLRARSWTKRPAVGKEKEEVCVAKEPPAVEGGGTYVQAVKTSS
jgi:hypothetical protein